MKIEFESSMEALIYALLSRLDKGKSLTRSELNAQTGIPDRTIRKIIEDLRQKGVPVVSSSYGGYHIATDMEEYSAWRKKEMARAKSILYTLSQTDRYMNNRDQVRF